jgi:hypothetical protein
LFSTYCRDHCLLLNFGSNHGATIRRLRPKVYHDSRRPRQIDVDLPVAGVAEQVHAQVGVPHRFFEELAP